MKAAAAIIGAIVLVVAIAVGGYQLEWWLKEDRTNRTTGIANDSLARQQARLDEVTDTADAILDIDVQISQVTVDQAVPLKAQRIALVDKFCDAYGGLTGRLSVPQSSETLYIQEC